jgi:hypothetical protein
MASIKFIFAALFAGKREARNVNKRDAPLTKKKSLILICNGRESILY